MNKDIAFLVESNRVLVPTGEPCIFGCKYCYTRSGEVGPSRIEVGEILKQFHAFATQRTFETIQLGYDGDPFANPERGLELLWGLVGAGKHINFSTKAIMKKSTVSELASINDALKRHGKLLSALVSLSCWESAHDLEPHTPPPAKRIITIKNLKSIGIPTFIALRPILPNIEDVEYKNIIIEGIRADSNGFILGPLYADIDGRFTKFIPSDTLINIPSIRRRVSWSPHSPLWTRYEDKARTERIASFIRFYGGNVFTSSAEAVHSFAGIEESM